MATACTSAAARRSITVSSACSSIGVTTPRGPVRSRTAKRSSGGTSGAGRSRQGRYSSGRVWRASSITSVNPSVASSAVRAPRSSSSAFVPTVMPCAKRVTADGGGAGLLQHQLHRRHHPLGLVARGRGHLGGVKAVRGDQHGVGERAADVDAQQQLAAARRAVAGLLLRCHRLVQAPANLAAQADRSDRLRAAPVRGRLMRRGLTYPACAGWRGARLGGGRRGPKGGSP